MYFCELKHAIRYIQMSIIKDRIRSARKEILRRHRSRISPWNCWDKPFLQRSSSEPGPKPSTDPIYVSDTCHPCGPDSSRCLVYHWQGLSAKLFTAGGDCIRSRWSAGKACLILEWIQLWFNKWRSSQNLAFCRCTIQCNLLQVLLEASMELQAVWLSRESSSYSCIAQSN